MIYVVGGVFIVLVGASAFTLWAMRLKAIGVSRPCLAMFVGGTDSATAEFIHKPRWSRTPVTTTYGVMELFRIGDVFELVPSGAPLGRLEINTRVQPVVVATARGLSEGEGEIQINGDDESGDTYKENSLPVIVMDPSVGTLALYLAAVAKAKAIWSHGTTGNWKVNILGGARRGLCDQWAEWTANWLKEHNDGTICRIEMCLYGDKSVFAFRHQFVRITMCETGEIFYVDAHKSADNPVIPKDEYEKEFNAPDTTWDMYP